MTTTETIHRTVIKLKRGHSADWAEANPILAPGEAGFEIDTSRVKIGDGVNPYNSLPYTGEVDLQNHIDSKLPHPVYDDGLQTRISDLITAIGTDYKQLRTWISGSSTGDLTGLGTTDKSSLVGAINEVLADVGAGTAPDASETTKGIAELATLAEVAMGTDTLRIVTPAGVRQEVGDRTTLATTTKTSLVAAVNELHGEIGTAPDASETVKGIVELATLVEVATGTDTVRAVTAAGVRQERLALKDEILGAGVPAALDTLDELATALGDDANFASTVTTALGNRVRTDTAAQGLDATAQSNARTNISVYSQAELGNPDTDLAALYTAAKA
jgi:hypothetical protein